MPIQAAQPVLRAVVVTVPAVLSGACRTARRRYRAGDDARARAANRCA